MPKTTQPILFKYCFAVTGHYVIIPLQIVAQKQHEDFVKIHTAIVGEADHYAKTQHRLRYEELWLDENGLPDSSHIFMNKQDAIDRAITQAQTAATEKREELSRLEKTLTILRAQKK
jgi:hypothetical protein